MVEQGKVISISKDMAEVELPFNDNCTRCKVCLSAVPEKKILTAYNSASAKVGDSVNVIIGGNKITAGFLIYIVPLISFFLFAVLAQKIFHIKNEPLTALAGFAGMLFSYFIIRIFPRSGKTKNIVIEILDAGSPAQ